MFKKLITILVLVCLVLCLCTACSEEKVITADEAWAIVKEDIGAAAETAKPHIHNGTYENQECFSIYVTVNGESLQYVVSTTGEIIHKGHGAHSH